MHINFGMRDGGGYGSIVLYPSYNKDTGLYLYRVAYDLVFFLTMIILILEIIFGLIVDSFSSLRELKNINCKIEI